MDAIILAGGIPSPDDSLHTLTQGKSKALLQINGRSLLDYVLEALLGSSSIDHILVVGLPIDVLNNESKHLSIIPDQGGFVQNGIAGLRWMKNFRGKQAHVAMVSVDIPLLTSDIVDQVIANCRPLTHKLFYHFVSRAVFEERFPNSQRTFVKLKQEEIAGADFLIAHTDFAELDEELFETLANGRKQAWKLARIVGFRFLLKFLMRQVGIQEIEEITSHVAGMPVKVVLTPHAEIGMDIDKKVHFDLIEKTMR